MNRSAVDRDALLVRYERDPSAWLSQQLPAITLRAVAAVDENTFLVLLTKTDATRLQHFLLDGLSPPFSRRWINEAEGFAPGLVLAHREYRDSQRLLRAYKLLNINNLDITDRLFIQQQIEKLRN